MARRRSTSDPSAHRANVSGSGTGDIKTLSNLESSVPLCQSAFMCIRVTAPSTELNCASVGVAPEFGSFRVLFSRQPFAVAKRTAVNEVIETFDGAPPNHVSVFDPEAISTVK